MAMALTGLQQYQGKSKMKARLLALTGLVVLAACVSTPAPKPIAPSATAPAKNDLAVIQTMPPSVADIDPPAVEPVPPIAKTQPTPRVAAAPSVATVKPKSKPPVRPMPAPVAKSRAGSNNPAPKTTPVPQAAPVLGVFGGRLQLIAGKNQKIAAGEVADGLVYYLPQGGAPKPKPGNFTITTQSKGFSPNLLVIPAGSTVAFPNKDTILHNVYSRSPGSEFHAGHLRSRRGQENRAAHAGPGDRQLQRPPQHARQYRRAVHALLHTPQQGWQLHADGLPAGKGTLVFWHPRSSAITQPVSVGATTPIVKQLTASKPRLDAHMLMGP